MSKVEARVGEKPGTRKAKAKATTAKRRRKR
jgi:hypothetical protein